MRTLVTGAGGFLGRCIVKKLIARGYEVRGLVRQNHPELAALGVELIKTDLRDREATINACKNADVVFHAAAKVDHWGKWEEFEATNILGTQHVIEGCRKHNVPKLIYTSTPSVIFNKSDLCYVDETQPYPLKYNSHYAASKAKAEQLVLSSNHSELMTVALRPHLIWGPADNSLVPGIIRQAKKGRLFMIGNKKVMMDFTYVDNVADAHLLAANRMSDNRAIGGNAYFITQDEPVYVWDFVNRLLERLGIPPVNKRIPTSVAQILAATSETLFSTFPLKGEPRLTRFLVGQMSHSHYFNISKAVNELGYKPLISTSDGLDKTVEYFDLKKQTNQTLVRKNPL